MALAKRDTEMLERIDRKADRIIAMLERMAGTLERPPLPQHYHAPNAPYMPAQPDAGEYLTGGDGATWRVIHNGAVWAVSREGVHVAYYTERELALKRAKGSTAEGHECNYGPECPSREHHIEDDGGDPPDDGNPKPPPHRIDGLHAPWGNLEEDD